MPGGCGTRWACRCRRDAGGFTEPLPDPLGNLISRYARTHGPFGADAVAWRYALGIAVVAGTLRRLAAAGRVVEGEFLPGGRGTEWCDAEVLRLLRRRCLARLRKEAEPAPPRRPGPAAARLAGSPAHRGLHRPRRAPGSLGPAAGAGEPDRAWRGAGRHRSARRGSDPASALETLVLPGRVPGYSPAMLDELTTAGEVVWTGAGGLPGGDGWLVLASAESAPLLFPEPVQITMTPVHEAVLTALSDGGAVFFRMLHERVPAELAWVEGTAKAPSDMDVAAAIWDLLWAGLLTNDTLGPLRTVLGGGQPRKAGSPGSSGRSPARNRGSRYGSRRPCFGRPVMPSRTGPPNVSGRWSLLPQRPRRDDARACAGPVADRPVRDPDQGRGGGGADIGRVLGGVPGPAGHGGGGPGPAGLLRGGTRCGPVRDPGCSGPDARPGAAAVGRG